MTDNIRVQIDYTNHAGVRQLREIEPHQVRFSNSKWHRDRQWLLDAYDVGKGAARTFAMADIHDWQPADGRVARVDVSIAKRLQAALEKNIRMELRLKKLGDHQHCPADIARALSSILADEEPAWHQE
jgi:predicted DNA-binding transcriptional regulator YafY